MTGASEPVFHRSGHTNLFWSTDPDSARRLAFLSSGVLTGPDETLSQTWSDGAGVYLILSAVFSDTGKDALLEQALREFLGWRGWPAQGQRVFWLDLSGTGDPSPYNINGTTLDTAVIQGSTVLARGNDFSFGGYFFSCTSRSGVGLSADKTAIGISGRSVLASPGNIYPAASDSVLIPMTGKMAGCLSFTVDLPNGGKNPGETDFDLLSVGLRYGQPTDDGGVEVLHLPVLRQPGGALEMYGTLDPLHPLDPTRSRLSFFSPGGGGAPGEMTSNFVTARGHGVLLTPSAAGQRPAGFVFGVQPLMAGDPDTQVPVCYYLTPDGQFDFWVKRPPSMDKEAVAGEIERLVCGASGLEYVGFPYVRGNSVMFLPGKPNFAPFLEQIEHDTPLLNQLGTTSWLYVNPAPGNEINYYTQPGQAPLFGVSNDTFLSFLEMPTAKLPSVTLPVGFPVAPYLGIGIGTANLAKSLEIRALAPERQRVIAGQGENTNGLDADQVGVTRQGLAVGVPGNVPAKWSWLGIAKTRETSTLPDLRFTEVSGDFRQAMQANRLFAVLADANTVMSSGSIPYLLTDDAIKEIRADQSVPNNVIDAVVAAHIPGVLYNTEIDFITALKAAAPAITPDSQNVFMRAAGQFFAEIESWRFQLSPRNWSNPQRASQKNAFLIIKLTHDRTLKDYAADPGSWTWREAANTAGQIDTTVAEMNRIITDAETRYNAQPGADNPYHHFVKTILADPNWVGVVSLGADVPLESLPEPLRPLEVGIDPAKFFSHHMGFNLTPFSVENGPLTFKQTSMFGLIDYNDPDDLLLEENIEFAFKVLRLAVGFTNSTISSFSSKIELMVNRMFGVPARLYPTEHGNNLILDGTYQKQLGSDNKLHGTYLFSSAGHSIFQTPDTALQTVEILSTRLVNDPPGSGSSPDQVTGVFQMSGNLRFWDSRGFDPFCYGPVAPPPPPPDPPETPEPPGSHDEVFLAQQLPGTPGEPEVLIDGEEEEWIDTPFGRAKLIPGSTVTAEEMEADRAMRAERKAAHQAAKLDAAKAEALKPESAKSELAELETVVPAEPDGYLKFDNLGVSMSFDRFARQPVFKFVTDGLSFDTAHSIARPNSLANRFPVKLRGLVAKPNLAPAGEPPSGQDPKDMGYVSVTAHGFEQSLMTPPWFALEYELNLGTLGALAASAGLVMTVLAGWSSGGTDDAPAVYFGIHLPGMKDAVGVELPLQGVLKLGFRNIEFWANPVENTDPVQLAYLIRFRNFALSLFGISFPPGYNDIYLFGNPDQNNATTLGWYAAYAQEDDEKKNSGQVNTRLLATRQAPVSANEQKEI